MFPSLRDDLTHSPRECKGECELRGYKGEQHCQRSPLPWWCRFWQIQTLRHSGKWRNDSTKTLLLKKTFTFMIKYEFRSRKSLMKPEEERGGGSRTSFRTPTVWKWGGWDGNRQLLSTSPSGPTKDPSSATSSFPCFHTRRLPWRRRESCRAYLLINKFHTTARVVRSWLITRFCGILTDWPETSSSSSPARTTKSGKNGADVRAWEDEPIQEVVCFHRPHRDSVFHYERCKWADE